MKLSREQLVWRLASPDPNQSSGDALGIWVLKITVVHWFMPSSQFVSLEVIFFQASPTRKGINIIVLLTLTGWKRNGISLYFLYCKS